MSNPAYLEWMRSAVNSLPANFRALRVQTVHEDGGIAVLRVEYSAPSPLGVFAPAGGNPG